MLTGRWCGGIADIACSSMKTSPRVGASNPASTRNKVVLPQPEGPRSEKNSPRRISRFTSFTALTPPNSLETFRIEMMCSSFIPTAPRNCLDVTDHLAV